MEDVPKFTTPRRPPAEARSAVPRFVRSALDAKEEAKLWQRIAFGSLAFCVLFMYFTFKASRPLQMGFVIGQDGTSVSGPLIALSKNSEFFRKSSIYAAQAALMRSEEGMDLPELSQLYFDAIGLQRLQENLKLWHDDFKRRKLSWKPSILSVSEPVDVASTKVVEIKAVLKVSGIFSGRALYEERDAKLLLSWIPNTDLQTAGTYPWKVRKVEFTIGDAR